MRRLDRIVITGIGLTAPNGNNLTDFRKSLLDCRAGVNGARAIGIPCQRVLCSGRLAWFWRPVRFFCLRRHGDRRKGTGVVSEARPALLRRAPIR